MPTVILGRDMPAELAADVSTTLREMGVAVTAESAAPVETQTIATSETVPVVPIETAAVPVAVSATSPSKRNCMPSGATGSW